MDRRAVEAAERELGLACQSAAEAAAAETPAPFNEARSDFLSHANCVFTKLEHGSKKGQVRAGLTVLNINVKPTYYCNMYDKLAMLTSMVIQF